MKDRDPYFDNLKAILIFLVVLGHFTNLNDGSPLVAAVNNVIYSFHMPLFIFVTGYFSKTIHTQRSAEIENVLYPYLFFQLLGYLFTRLTGLGYGTMNIFVPAYQNWYLLGVFIWRLLIPYYNFFTTKYALLLTLVLSFYIGYIDGFNQFLGLYRIIYFFPVFILGYYCSDMKELLLKYSNYRYVFISVSLVGLLAIFLASFFSSALNKQLSYAYTPYLNYDHHFQNFILRLIGFFSSLIISTGLLFLIPKRKIRITRLGEGTLNIFLLHTFFVFPISHYMKNVSGYLVLLISVTSSILICVILSSRFANEIAKPFTKMRQLSLLIKRNR